MENALYPPHPFFHFEDIPLSFVDPWDFIDADLQVIADHNSSVCQTMSQHDVPTSSIDRGGLQASAAVSEIGFPRRSIESGDDPKSGSEPTVTNHLGRDDDRIDCKDLVKKCVSSPHARRSGAARRKVEAKFGCPIKGCGGTFTRKQNLTCEQRQTSPFFWLLITLSEDHLNSHFGIREQVCKCRKTFNTKAAWKRHWVWHCILNKKKKNLYK
jgi:hypothetical protein